MFKTLKWFHDMIPKINIGKINEETFLDFAQSYHSSPKNCSEISFKKILDVFLITSETRDP